MTGLLQFITLQLNSLILTGALNGIELHKLVKETYEKMQPQNRTLEDQALYCFDAALWEFCSHYGYEYDAYAIYETFCTDIESIKKINSTSYQHVILKAATGIADLTSEQVENWSYFINKVIAEKKLTILSAYLTRVHESVHGTHMPRILTELAPRPPVEQQLVSRDEEKTSILSVLEERQKLVLVNGLGGVGKSTVCKELFYFLYQNSSCPLAWVTYNGKSLSDDFINQFYYPEQLLERKERLAYFLQTEISENAVIFVDNLNVRDIDDPFIQVLERAKCAVICTSRVTDYKYFVTIPVSLFKTDKCIQLFKIYANIPLETTCFDEVISQIVRKVAEHTLTIEILGKLASAENLTPADILAQLEEKGINLEGTVEVNLNEDTLVGHLCKIFPVNKLRKEHKYILSHFANCPLEQIPKLIKDWLGIVNHSNINYLKKYGWFVENTDSFYMHPIIKEVVKRICRLHTRDYETLIENLKNFTQYNRNVGIAPVLPYFPYIKSVLNNIDGNISPSTAYLFFNSACIEELAGNYENAIELFKKSLNIWENPEIRKFDISNIYMNTRKANINVQIGACFYYLGDTETARSWYDKTFYMTAPYKDKELSVQMYSNYALTYQKDLKNAAHQPNVSLSRRLADKMLSYFQKTVFHFQKLKKKDEFMARALYNLGNAYADLEEYQSAVNYLKQSLEIRQKLLGPLSPILEKTYYDLGRAFTGLAAQQVSSISKCVKYKIAFIYLRACQKICQKNTPKKINSTNLEETELSMLECEARLSDLKRH